MKLDDFSHNQVADKLVSNSERSKVDVSNLRRDNFYKGRLCSSARLITPGAFVRVGKELC